MERCRGCVAQVGPVAQIGMRVVTQVLQTFPARTVDGLMSPGRVELVDIAQPSGYFAGDVEYEDRKLFRGLLVKVVDVFSGQSVERRRPLNRPD